MVDKYANVLSLQIIAMWMTKIRETDAKPAVPFLAYAQDTFGIPMYIRTKTASSAPNFESAAVHLIYKVQQYSPYFTSVRIIRTCITSPGTVLYT